MQFLILVSREAGEDILDAVSRCARRDAGVGVELDWQKNTGKRIVKVTLPRPSYKGLPAGSISWYDHIPEELDRILQPGYAVNGFHFWLEIPDFAEDLVNARSIAQVVDREGV